MEFRVLGPLEVRSDSTVVPIGSAKKLRLVFGALLSRADEPAPLDWLIGAVWIDKPPASARQNLQHYIHRLRVVVGNDRIVSQPGGYMIRTGEGLDAARFRQLAVTGSTALGDRDTVRAVNQLRAALDLWRGAAYAEFTDCLAIADEVARLDGLRLSVYERWAEAELRLGHYTVPVEELTDLVRAHPYRESLRGYLMRALYGAGRQADALQLFRTTRAMLAEQLGVEPGPQLQRLHEQMLRGDGELAPRSVNDVTEPRAAVHLSDAVPIPRELPADVAGFVGRDEALNALDKLLPDDAERTTAPVVLSAVTGMAGVGKTALAVHWAHRVADHFPDGQLYLNLRGYAPGRPLRPIEALTELLGALGIPPRQVPVEVAAAAARYRSHLAGRRMLIVLDNARSSTQVRPLLPAGPGCLVLITSRDRLTGLVAKDGVRRLMLDVLSLDESVDLLRHLLDDERVVAEPAAAAALAQTCAHLPLALRIAGADLADQPHRTIANYAAELSASDPVAALAVDGEDDLAVRGAFELSYRTLPQPAQRMFRQLGLVPCPDFTAPAAAALAGTTESEARHSLDGLAAAHLVIHHTPGRYTMHDLLRQYALNLAATEDVPAERVAATRRLYDWLVSMSDAANVLLYPDALRLPLPADAPTAVPGLTATGTALDWLEAERHNLVAAILHAARHGPREVAWRCAAALQKYHALRVYLADWLSISRAAVAAARADRDPVAQAASYHGLAYVHFVLGHYPRSIGYLRRTLALATDAGWDHAAAAALKNLGIVLHRQGRTNEAIEYLRRALQVHDCIDWPLGRAKAMDNLAAAYQDCGRLHEGAELARRARDLYREGGAPFGEANASQGVGETYALLGRLDDAEQELESALSTCLALRSRRGEVHCRSWLARVHVDVGRLDEADECAKAAFDLADEMHDPDLQATALNAHALVGAARGDHTRAIQLYQAALTIAEKVDIRYTVGEALLGLAAALHACGDDQAAFDHAERALVLARQARFAVIEGRALTTLGQLYHRLGDTTRALDHARRALTNHQQTGHRIGEADTHVLLATIDHHLGEHAAAQDHRNSARSLYKEIGASRPSSAPD